MRDAARAACRSRFDHSKHGNGDGILDGVESQGAGGVAGDDQELGALFVDQELRAFDGVAGDGAARLGAVREARGVADEGKACLRGSVPISARRTVSPPNPESKTPMVGGALVVSVTVVVPSAGVGVGGQVGAGQVGVAGERGARLAVDQEANLSHLGQVGVGAWRRSRATVRVSVCKPDGWLAAKLPARLTTASCGAGCIGRFRSDVARQAGRRETPA